MSGKSKDISEKLAELDALVAWFDGDDFSINIALDKFKEAKALADEIERDLTELKNTVTVIGKQFDKE